MSKDCDVEICYYFGIGPIEEIFGKRWKTFINSYGATECSDNCLFQLLYCKD